MLTDCARRVGPRSGRNREVNLEEDIPTPQQEPSENAWLPIADAVGRRAKGAPSPPGQGAAPPDRLGGAAIDSPLRHRDDFRRIYDRGTAYRGRLFVLIVCENGRGLTRRAVVASRKIGGAVVRNRCKRILREAFRLSRGRMRVDGFDVVLIARGACRDAGSDEIRTELEGLLKLARLWTPEPGEPIRPEAS